MMKVQKIRLEPHYQPHWIVIDDDYLPIEPISNYLSFLHTIDKSPYTIRTYAYHLKIFWGYLIHYQLEWKAMNADRLIHFVATLRGLVKDNVTYIALEKPERSARTINQIVIAVTSFYQYYQHLGIVPELKLYQWKQRFNTQRTYKPLLHHLVRTKARRMSLIKLKEPKLLAKTVEASVVQHMITACKRLRDKFLLTLLYETGCRIGQALGLRHEDIETFNNRIIIRPRNDNTNGARAKTFEENVLPVSASLMQLYCDYYLQEYGEIDSDYVFVNLWQGEIGQPMSYNAVITLFQRISQKLGLHVTPHVLRHTHATELIQAGWNMAYVQKRLGHQDIQTTMNTYVHLSDTDMKNQYHAYLQRREKV